MADVQETLTTYSDILKFDYRGPIVQQFNNSSSFFARMKKDKSQTQGGNVYLPIRLSRFHSIGARADDGSLPDSKTATRGKLLVPTKFNYARFTITGPTISASRNNKGAFASAIKQDMEDLVADFSEDMNRQLMSLGTGQVARANGAGNNTTTLTVDDPSSLYMDEGMVIDASTSGTEIDSIEISTVVSSAVATLASAQTWSDNAIVYREDSKSNEIMGLLGIVDDGTVQGTIYGLSRTTYPKLKANIDSNSGTPRALTVVLAQKGCDLAEEKGNGKVSDILSGYGVRRAYFDLMDGLVRFKPYSTLDGGWQVLKFDGIPWHVDRHMWPSRILFLDMRYIKLYTEGDVDWMDLDGNVLSRVSGKDAYEATLYLYSELGASKFQCHTLISDITEA